MERATAMSRRSGAMAGGDPDRERQQALRRLHAPSTTSTSRSSRASSSRCSGPRDAARRRRCGCSPASRSRARDGSCSRASRSRTCRPTSATSTWSSRATRCSSHLDVAGNVAFGLKRRKVRKDEIKRRVDEALELVSLGSRADVAPERALRRSATAGRAGAGAGQPPGGAAARRAARRARPEAAPADAGRAQADPARGRDHVRLRHPRPGGGALDVGPDRRDERRQDRPVRGARGGLRAPDRGVRRRLHRDLEPARGRRRRTPAWSGSRSGMQVPAPLPDDCDAGDTVQLSVRPEKIAVDEEIEEGMVAMSGAGRVPRLPRRQHPDHGRSRRRRAPRRARAGDLPRPRRRSLGRGHGDQARMASRELPGLAVTDLVTRSCA